MIRKPKLRGSFRSLAAAAEKTGREAPAEDAEAGLTHPIAAPIEAAKSGGHERFVSRKPEGREEQLRHSTVARWDWVIWVFQRRVKSDAQPVTPRSEHSKRFP
jgi:hypothetical protein